MNFSKLFFLLKSNLKLQIYKHVIAKQKSINSVDLQSFQI